jgi:protease I
MENLVLYGKTIAFLATDGFEQIELTDPWSAIKNAGGTVKLVAPKFDGTIRGVTVESRVSQLCKILLCRT